MQEWCAGLTNAAFILCADNWVDNEPTYHRLADLGELRDAARQGRRLARSYLLQGKWGIQI